MNDKDKKAISGLSTEDLLREAAGRRDLPDAVTKLGGKALLFEAARPEWHVALPASNTAAGRTTSSSRRTTV